jgi:ABC-2 type transport system ATP-binding protein
MIVQTINLSKTYGKNKAVDNISLDLASGEITGFIGVNGAGKTTTMRLLTGYIKPDMGDITINNKPFRGADHKAIIGYLPENAPLYEDMLVCDYLKFMAKLRKINKQDISEALARVKSDINLHKVWKKKIANLSKGYKRRVALSQAVIHQPSILILDEPTDGLDPKQKRSMRSYIRKLAKEQKTTILLSTHILEEVPALCDKINVINNGQIIFSGTQQQLEAKYPNTNNLDDIFHELVG